MLGKGKRLACRGRSPRLSSSGWASGSRFTNTRLNHSSQRTGARAKSSGLNPFDSFDFGSVIQRAVEVVGPAMVEAAKKLAGATTFGGRSGAVTTDVEEATQSIVRTAHDQQGFSDRLGGEVVARLGDLIVMPDHLPGAVKNPIFFPGRRHRDRGRTGRAGSKHGRCRRRCAGSRAGSW